MRTTGRLRGWRLAAQVDGEVGRKDDLVIGDGGLVLRIGCGEELGHAADGLNHYVSAQEGTLLVRAGFLAQNASAMARRSARRLGGSRRRRIGVACRAR